MSPRPRGSLPVHVRAGRGDDGPTTEELNEVSDPIRAALLNRPINSIRFDKRSHDLSLTVEGENCVRTFLSSPDDDHVWHVRGLDGTEDSTSPSGFEVRTRNLFNGPPQG